MASDTIVLEGHQQTLRSLERAAAVLGNPAQFGEVTFAACEAIRSYMVTNMLSGQRLRRPTGKLQGSFNTQRLAGGASEMGTNTVYAPVHEFGLRSVSMVKAHPRNNPNGTVSQVKFHLRLVNFRERAYFRDSIRLSVAEQDRAIAVTMERLMRSI